MDLNPTSGQPGTAGPSRTTTALATDARRGITPPEVEREAIARTTERAAYTSPGLRPAGDVVVHLSQKALALAKAASNPPPRTRSVEHEEADDARGLPRTHENGGEDAGPVRRPIDARA